MRALSPTCTSYQASGTSAPSGPQGSPTAAGGGLGVCFGSVRAVGSTAPRSGFGPEAKVSSWRKADLSPSDGCHGESGVFRAWSIRLDDCDAWLALLVRDPCVGSQCVSR